MKSSTAACTVKWSALALLLGAACTVQEVGGLSSSSGSSGSGSPTSGGSTGSGSGCVAAKQACDPTDNKCCTVGFNQQMACGFAPSVCCVPEGKVCTATSDCCENFVCGPEKTCKKPIDDPNCAACLQCFQNPDVVGQCGTAAKPGITCKYNNGGSPNDSTDLYVAAHTCLCGQGGKGGPCATACPGLCADGAPPESQACVNCVNMAAGTTCKAQLTACQGDKTPP